MANLEDRFSRDVAHMVEETFFMMWLNYDRPDTCVS